MCRRFQAEDFSKLCAILERAVAVPVHGEASPFILPSLTEVVLTKLQEAVLACLDTVEKVRADSVVGKTFAHVACPELATGCLGANNLCC